MDFDCSSTDDPSAPKLSGTQCSVHVDGASAVVELNRRAVAGSAVEDLDSYNLIEPPPLDWKSDSSSEAASADDLENPSPDDLDKGGSGEPVLGVKDTGTPVDRTQQGKNTEPTQDPEEEVEEEDGSVEEKGREWVTDLEDGREYREAITHRDVENTVTEEAADRSPGDEDHTRIHTLLSQLQLMGEEPHPSRRAPPCFEQHQSSSPSRLESSSLVTDDSTETTGLLFSESHQGDVLGLLECTEITSPAPPTGLPNRGDVDAVVSVSYNPEDAQRFWGHYGNGQQHRHREDSLTSLPDDEYPEPVWMKLGEEPPGEEAAAVSEQVG